MSVSDFRVGQRVQLQAWLDRWMQGDRYGEVTKVGRRLLSVRMDRSGQTITVNPNAIQEVVS